MHQSIAAQAFPAALGVKSEYAPSRATATVASKGASVKPNLNLVGEEERADRCCATSPAKGPALRLASNPTPSAVMNA